MRISFLTPRLPPAVCGLADHTRLLAGAVRAQGVAVGFIHRESREPGGDLPPGPVDRWDGSRKSLVECTARQQARWLWVQLSSYGYSRWGAPARLVRGLRRLRRALPGVRVAVCAHETHCQPHQLGRKGRLLSPWQRYCVGAAVREADVVFTSSFQYACQVVDDYHVPRDRVVRLPIGANVPDVRLTAVERAQLREGLGWQPHDLVAVAFGSYGSQLRALDACGEHLAHGLASGGLQRVACVGGAGPVPASLSGWVDRLGGPGRVHVFGHQSGDRVATLLAACDVGFSGYPESRLGKSGVFAAFAQAGLPVIVPPSAGTHSVDPETPRALVLTSFDWGRARSGELTSVQETMRAYARDHLPWPAIARKALAALEGEHRRAATVGTAASCAAPPPVAGPAA